MTKAPQQPLTRADLPIELRINADREACPAYARGLMREAAAALERLQSTLDRQKILIKQQREIIDRAYNPQH